MRANDMEKSFHLFMDSRIGALPIKVTSLGVFEEEEGASLRWEIYIDKAHPNCPDLGQLSKKEYSDITNYLRVAVPEKMDEIMEE